MKNSAFIKLASEEDSAYVDIYTEYGVSFFKGSYLKLLMKSAAKQYVENESRLEHGVRMLARETDAKFQKRDLSLSILMEADTVSQFATRLEAFTEKVSKGKFFLKIPSKHRVFKLVYSDLKIKNEYRGNRATFTLEITEPNPEDRIVLQ